MSIFIAYTDSKLKQDKLFLGVPEEQSKEGAHQLETMNAQQWLFM